MLRWREISVGSLVIAGVFSLGRIIYLDADFASRLPSHPDHDGGREHSMTIHHGVRVFASDEEFRTFDNAKTEALWFGIAAVAGVGWYQIWRQRTR